MSGEKYRCICCGYEKESQKACRCPNCGYRMYPAPYERREVLLREIRGFVRSLEVREVRRGDLSFPGKEKDDGRFPSFDRIFAYVCGAERTENYFKRLRESLDELCSHLGKPFEKSYPVKYTRLQERIARQEKVLGEALSKIGAPQEFEEAVFGEAILEYKEEPDPKLYPLAEELLHALGELSEKAERFIRKNNIYGFDYRGVEIRPVPEKEPDWERLLLDAAGEAAALLERRYVVDLFSDGSEELGQMLGVLWSEVKLLMTAPVLRGEERFRAAGGNSSPLPGKAFREALAEEIACRYQAADAQVFSGDLLESKGEEELFSLYNGLIPLDREGFFGIVPKKLLAPGESERALRELIGLSAVKESIRKIKAYVLANQHSSDLSLHMCFYGNPGTGKTEVARLIAGILHENHILPTKKVVEVDRSGLVGQYVGETPQKTMKAIQEAMGGVLFVDEAYALVQEQELYGMEAVATLLKAMEDYRGQFCVILAGYSAPMKKLLESNPGFRSRIQFHLEFPNYSREELEDIARGMLAKRKYTITAPAMAKILDVTDVKRKEPNFANAREIRNILDQVIMCQNLRAADAKDREIAMADVSRYIRDGKIPLPVDQEAGAAANYAPPKILTGQEELEQLTGLSAVKKMVKKIRAYAKRNVNQPDFNLHMCFLGNPGTGKTEVARILSRILYDAGVLPEAKLVETDASGLIGKYVGETGPKTQAKIEEAMGGVLFVDEAYSLLSSQGAAGTAGYGEEAIAALLKGMEDYRGKFCVILAGYQGEMRELLNANPGFASRIQFTMEFPDYTREELKEIARTFLQKKRYSIEEDALERVLDAAEASRNRPNFANARTLRNILDQVILNQNLRAEDEDGDFTIILEDVEDYIQETGVMEENAESRRIGF